MSRSSIVAVAAYTLALLVTSGCAPRFVEVNHQPPRAWLERVVIVRNDAVETSRQRELVQTELNGIQLGPMERVRWIEGINLNSTRIQRTTERQGAEGQRLSQAAAPANEAGLVQSVLFGVHEGRLSAEGELALKNFQGRGERYFVEFLYRGPIDEVATREMTSAWVDLSKRLTQRGIDPKNFVMGGSKYHQRVNAIAFVKVGQ